MTKQRHLSTLIIAALCTSVGVLIFLYVRKDNSKAKPANKSTVHDRRLDRLRQEVSALRRQVWSLSMNRHRIANKQPSVASQPKKDPVSERRPGVPKDDLPIDPVDADRKHHEIYEKSFAEQPIDAKWAATKEQDIIDYLSSHERLTPGCCEVEYVECRQSMCKTVVLHKGMESAMAFRKVVKRRPFESAHRIETNGDFTKSTIYAARIGHSFPLYIPGEGATRLDY